MKNNLKKTLNSSWITINSKNDLPSDELFKINEEMTVYYFCEGYSNSVFKGIFHKYSRTFKNLLHETVKQKVTHYQLILQPDPPITVISFQFLYRKKQNQIDSQSFYSKKQNIKEAMDDFLTRKRNLYDIDPEVEVTYKSGKTEFIQVDARQDWDSTWYFVFENQMICGNGYECSATHLQQ
jgi:hypothetical protein